LTLSRFEKQIADSTLNVMKTHRSYVVNLDAIEDVKGNAQGFLLKLYGAEELVPVSRNNINDFNVLMKG
jgi:DNA-binding LytR/AlgR family response regulator